MSNRTLILAALAFAVPGTVLATPVVISQWGFNDGTTNPSVGAGSFLLVGGVTPASSGAFAASSSPDGGSAYNTDHFPAQGVGSGTGGFEFDVSTVGYGSITFNFDGRTSATASRNFEVQYSTDGGATWISTTVFSPFTNTNWHNGNTVDLSSDPALNNNPNARFRVVSVFQPSTSAYQASGATSTYNGTTGTMRIDGVIISGEPIASTPPTATDATAPLAGCAGDTTLFTITITPGQNPVSISYTVVADLSAMGGSATQAFFDDGSNGDAASGDGTFSYTATAGGTPGLKTLPFTVTDDQNRTATGALAYGVGNCTNNSASTVVISQVYGGGGSAGSVWDGDYVELFNRSTTPVALDGSSVQYASAGGVVSASQVRLLSGTIAGNGYYLVRMSNQPQPGANSLPAVDAGSEVAVGGGIFTSNISGKVFLASITTPIADCSDAAIMDKVGYGTAASCFEGGGSTIDLAGGSTLLSRKLDGCQDSDENFNDFERVFDLIPRNTASPTHSCVSGPLCGTSDFDGDGDSGTDADIEAFFACLAGNCCPTCFPGGSDFDADGDSGTDCDITNFFRVLAGSACGPC